MKKLSALFIDFSGNFYDRHAVYAIAAGLRARGVEVLYFPASSFAAGIGEVKRRVPSMVLYSAWSNNIQTYIDFDRCLKEKMTVASLIGGAGPTFDSSMLYDSTIDYVCVGEGG